MRSAGQRHRIQRDIPLHQFAHRQPRRAIAIRGIDRNAAIGAHGAQRRCEVAAEVYIHDMIDALAAGDVAHACGDVLAAIVDHVVGAAGASPLSLGVRTDRGDHRGAGPLRELHRVVSDRTRGTGHQQRASLYRAGDEHAVMRGHAGHAESRTFRERYVFRQRRHQIDIQRDVFRCGAHPAAVALAVVEPDAATHPGFRHHRSDAIDHAGAIAGGDDAGVLHGGHGAAAAVGVRRVHASSLELDPDLVATGLGSSADRRTPTLHLPVLAGRTRRRASSDPSITVTVRVNR